DKHGALFGNEQAVDHRDVIGEQSNAAHGGLVSDGVVVEGSVDAVAAQTLGIVVDALEADPVLADGGGGVIGVELLAGARVGPTWVGDLAIGADNELAHWGGVLLA